MTFEGMLLEIEFTVNGIYGTDGYILQEGDTRS